MLAENPGNAKYRRCCASGFPQPAVSTCCRVAPLRCAFQPPARTPLAGRAQQPVGSNALLLRGRPAGDGVSGDVAGRACHRVGGRLGGWKLEGGWAAGRLGPVTSGAQPTPAIQLR